jgi:hypothetical protein
VAGPNSLADDNEALVDTADSDKVTEGDDQVLVDAPWVLRKMGGRSVMWLHRRLTDQEGGFPRPFVIANRRYWRRGDILSWLAGQTGSTRRPNLDENAHRRLREGQDQARARRQRSAREGEGA